MKSPLIIRTTEDLQKWRRKLTSLEIGFVPTMGALHKGHGQLLEQCREENAITVLSIYVNPTQFNNPEDLQKYPKTWEQDCQWATEKAVDVIFAPEFSDIYFDKYRYKIQENEESKILCGAHRPGHFDGVLTIVMKLLHLVQPRRAYFGEKDFQQLRLIQGMVKSFFMDVDIVPVRTVREESGLALSSRNQRLTEEQRHLAAVIHENLQQKISLDEVRKNLRLKGMTVDYVEDHWNRRFVAAHLGSVRLIDNAELPKESTC